MVAALSLIELGKTVNTIGSTTIKSMLHLSVLKVWVKLMQTGAREPLSANFDMPRLRLIDYDIIITLALCVWCHRQTPYVLCAYSLRTLRTPHKLLNNILYL